MYGAYLLAIYNEEEEQFQSISKIGTGFSEQLLTDLSASLEPTIIPAAKPYYLCAFSGLFAVAYLLPGTYCLDVIQIGLR